MRNNNLFVYGPQVVIEVLRDIVYFPLWWYSFGLVEALKKVKNFIINRERSLGLLVWIKNIFTPMYGQRDIAGVLISFFMRLVQIVFRGVAMLFWLAAAVCLVAAWLLAPIFIIYQIIYQIS